MASFDVRVPEWRPTWGSSTPANNARAEMMRKLIGMGGRHLVVVRYAAGHDPAHEWVYNAADIEKSPIVWAREMDAVRNAKLVDYFADRRIWLLYVDHGCTLFPYPK